MDRVPGFEPGGYRFESCSVRFSLMSHKISIFSLTQKQFAEQVVDRLGKGAYHASQIYSDWFKEGAVSSSKEWIEPQAKALVEEIIQMTDFTLPRLSLEKQEGEVSKFLLEFEDGFESESVMIPMQFGMTLCISSQVGCKMGCAFCETGKMGRIRHLSVQEIVAQVFYARFHLQKKVRNIVFMGMGEPFDNYFSVMQAIRVLTCYGGMSFGPSRITVSTSGLVDKIYEFASEADPAINLAISVNAPNDVIRNRLMPVNKVWDMAKLKEAMEHYCSHPRREILAEYVLIANVNDSLDHARELAEYLQGLKVKINLIPYNPQSRDVFSPPSEESKEAFLSYLRECGYKTLLRGTKGRQIMAACGQLGNRKQRERLVQLAH